MQFLYFDLNFLIFVMLIKAVFTLVTEKIRGIVLEELVSGESSKHVIVLAKGIGKCRLLAKGARKSKSKLMAGTQLFCYCDFLVVKGRGFSSITQVDMIESFYALRTDLDRLTEAVGMLKLVGETCLEGENNDKSLSFLLRALWLMSKKDYNPKQAALIFMWKHLQFAGLMPTTEYCAVCGRNIEDSYLFNMNAGGFVCTEHKLGSQRVEPSVQAALSYIFANDGKEAFSFRVSDKLLLELCRLCSRYLEIHWRVVLGNKYKY